MSKDTVIGQDSKIADTWPVMLTVVFVFTACSESAQEVIEPGS